MNKIKNDVTTVVKNQLMDDLADVCGPIAAEQLTKTRGIKTVYVNDLGICVSEDGTIFKGFSEAVKPVKQHDSNSYGYQHISIWKDGAYVSTTVQRVVAYAFKLISAISYSKCPLDVDHINNNVRDNRLCNLQVLTHSDNIKKRDLGRSFNHVIVYKNGALYKSFKSQVECAKDLHVFTSNLSNVIRLHLKYNINGDVYTFEVSKAKSSGKYVRTSAAHKGVKLKAVNANGTILHFASIMDACRHYHLTKRSAHSLIDVVKIKGVTISYDI